MLLQTNSYVVPKERRSEHARIVRRFKQALHRLGCDQFEVYEQAGANWSTDEGSGRFVQIMRFRDRRHQLAVQAAERNDPMAQAIIAEFCELINFAYQHQQGLFAIGYYTSILNSGRDRDGEQSQMTPEGAARPRVVPPYPQSAALEAVLDHVDPAPEHSDKPPTEIIEQATALMDVPFADVPMHEPAGSVEEPITAGASPVNGSALSHEPSPDTESVDPHASARELDQMIRRHFGDESESNGATLGELTPERNGHESDSAAGGSGIGAILDAARNGIDVNEAFPADLMDPDELLDAADPTKPLGSAEHPQATHIHAPPIQEFNRDENDR
ncbi:MAG TPA: hypothetical protein VFC46_04540 [Humisphaera sp.]|nr:hypothetical protein [Humisphaera sp.]